MKKTFFFLFYLLILVLFFVGFEFLLRLFNVGIDTSPFAEYKYKKGFYTDNPYFLNKYYPGVEKNVIVSPKNFFKRKKEQDTIRGFVIGGSTAQGFPYHSNFSFSKMTETILNKSQTFKKTEIINLGYSAMSSYYVRDVAKKLLKFEPDFIVIYSGHNEFYGAVSHTTSRGHLGRLVYIKLKDYRFFQLIMKFVEKGRNPITKNKKKNLMSIMLSHKIKPDPKVDNIVYSNYIKNIKSVVKFYSHKNIPVIIIDPVSNLIDMPPFLANATSEEKKIISEYYNAIKRKNSKLISQFYSKYKESTNLYISFLNQISNIFFNKTVSLDALKDIRDNDNIPFRAKSLLNKKLADFYKKYKMKYNMYYLKAIDQTKPENIGNKIFIDHLHFTELGNLKLASALSSLIAQMYSKYKMAKVYIYSPEIEKITAERKIINLFKQPPYSNMLVPYNANINIDFSEKYLQDKKVQSIILSSNENDIYNDLFYYFMEHDQLESARKIADIAHLTFPGSKISYFMYGLISEKKQNFDLAQKYFKQAYIITNKKNKNIRSKINN